MPFTTWHSLVLPVSPRSWREIVFVVADKLTVQYKLCSLKGQGQGELELLLGTHKYVLYIHTCTAVILLAFIFPQQCKRVCNFVPAAVQHSKAAQKRLRHLLLGQCVSL